ncbi:unnamed protein product [Protopolystoma xenopodis]|uniref:RRM domain-containing protein n=1 Tax=Protopolystoma xenopodis TaxID=117903 RepID=A0A3S5BQY7_9PLAT|nr:unnamed protein product [Protopolystoma xenopodis]
MIETTDGAYTFYCLSPFFILGDLHPSQLETGDETYPIDHLSSSDVLEPQSKTSPRPDPPFLSLEELAAGRLSESERQGLSVFAVQRKPETRSGSDMDIGSQFRGGLVPSEGGTSLDCGSIGVSSRLYVKNVARSVTVEDLRQVFGGFSTSLNRRFSATGAHPLEQHLSGADDHFDIQYFTHGRMKGI